MIVSASRFEAGRTVSFSGLESGSIGTVSVTTMPLISSVSAKRSSESSQKRPWVAKSQTSLAPCSPSARTFAIIVPPVMITSSPMIARLPRTRPAISVTDGDVVRRARLVHDRELRLDHLGEALRLLRAAGVGGDRDDSLARQPEVAEVAGEERQRGHVVDRDREEALDLSGVQVHGQDPVGARDLEQVGDEPRGDRLTRLRLAVLARIGEERDHRRDPLGRAELRRLDHLQELHQVPVDRVAPGLDDEEVGAANRLVVADVGLAVRERLERHLAELDAELLGDPLGELGMRAPGEHHQPLLRPPLDPVAGLRLGLGSITASAAALSSPGSTSSVVPVSSGIALLVFLAGSRDCRARPAAHPW